MMNIILDADEVAKLLKLNEQTIKRLANRGELPGFKIGGRWRFKRQDIEDYIEEQKRRYSHKQIGQRLDQNSATKQSFGRTV